ncbi:MAG: RNA polymerase sigma factor [Anaerolineae bacterium]|nr:RNA polymerase sigma factor [Anaerolineae bacterium]
MTGDPDLLLLRAMAKGDVQALEALYARHGRHILAYLRGLLADPQQAEEVLQDVMMAAWRGAGSFRGDSQVKTWLIGIARRQAFNAIRRQQPDATPLDEDAALDDTGVFRKVALNAEREVIRAAIRELPADQRETLELIFYHELSGVEAAVVMGVAEGTIKSRLHRAKATLRGILQRKEAGYGE